MLTPHPHVRPAMKIQDLMTTEVRTCAPGSSLRDAAAIMWEADCGCVPVVDDGRRVVGWVTDRDVAMAAYFQNRALCEIPVSSVMSAEPATCLATDTPETAELLMQERRIRRLPVVDDRGALVGIVSLADIAYYMTHRQSFGGDGMSWVCIGRTFAAISEPRRRAGGAAE